MLILGDVFATLFLFLGTSAAVVAMMVLAALAMPDKTQQAAYVVQDSLPRTVGLGLLVGAPLLLFSFVLVSLQIPLVTLLGFAVMAVVFLIGAVGAGTMARVMGERLRREAPGTNDMAAMVKGSVALVLATWIPIFGQLVLAPLFLLAAIGGGVKTLWPRTARNTSREVAG
jgi:hypothetical protein